MDISAIIFAPAPVGVSKAYISGGNKQIEIALSQTAYTPPIKLDSLGVSSGTPLNIFLYVNSKKVLAIPEVSLLYNTFGNAVLFTIVNMSGSISDLYVCNITTQGCNSYICTNVSNAVSQFSFTDINNTPESLVYTTQSLSLGRSETVGPLKTGDLKLLKIATKNKEYKPILIYSKSPYIGQATLSGSLTNPILTITDGSKTKSKLGTDVKPVV